MRAVQTASETIRGSDDAGTSTPARSWLWLSGTAAALAAGIGATVTPDAATWFGVRGPHCPLGSCLGPLACPGCGLVRSTAATLQGEFAGAFAFHPAGIAVAALLGGTFVLHFDILRRGHEAPGHRRLRRLGHLTLAAAVVVGWLLRILLQRT